MHHGIFHERLQQQSRHEREAHDSIDLVPDAEPVRKPHLLDGEIAARKVQFIVERTAPR